MRSVQNKCSKKQRRHTSFRDVPMFLSLITSGTRYHLRYLLINLSIVIHSCKSQSITFVCLTLCDIGRQTAQKSKNVFSSIMFILCALLLTVNSWYIVQPEGILLIVFSAVDVEF